MGYKRKPGRIKYVLLLHFSLYRSCLKPDLGLIFLIVRIYLPDRRKLVAQVSLVRQPWLLHLALEPTARLLESGFDGERSVILVLKNAA